MPYWHIFAPEDAFTDQDKQELSESITSLYVDFVNLPKFYVVVLFQPLPQNTLYVGAKPANNFVRIVVDHIARRVEGAELRALCMEVIEAKLAPWIRDRGYDWEVHVDETPADLWRTQGLVPPPAGSDAERMWAEKNEAIPYELASVN